MNFQIKMGNRSPLSVESGYSGVNRLVVLALLCLFVVEIVEVQTATGIDVSTGLCGTLVRHWGYPCNEYTVRSPK